MKRVGALLAVNVLLSAILVELALQAVHAGRRRFDHPILARIDERLAVKDSWEEYFLQFYLTGRSIVYAGIHRPHPTRGWAMKPSVRSVPEPDLHYTTNRQGFRALYDYENDPNRYQVLILGDSFTFGDEIGDEITWPALLQARSPRLNVLNMGTGGYGIDQMLITLQEEIVHYRPRLVVCAFVTDDLWRSMLPFRDYKKPYFVLDDGRLVLHNTPVGDVDSVVDEIARGRGRFYSYSPVQTINLLNGFFSDLIRPAEGRCSKSCLDLNEAIVGRMHDVAGRSGAEFLLVYLPWGDQIKDAHARSYGETFFDTCSRQPGMLSLNPRSGLLQATFEKAAGHYRRNENALLSGLVSEKIETLDSWRSWTAPSHP